MAAASLSWQDFLFWVESTHPLLQNYEICFNKYFVESLPTTFCTWKIPYLIPEEPWDDRRRVAAPGLAAQRLQLLRDQGQLPGRRGHHLISLQICQVLCLDQNIFNIIYWS